MSLRTMWVGVVTGLEPEVYQDGVRLCVGESEQEIWDDIGDGLFEDDVGDEPATKEQIERLVRQKGWLCSVQEYPFQDDVLDKVRQYVSDLQSKMYINCVYCGHRYGPVGSGDIAMDVLHAHVIRCVAHPMSAMRIKYFRLLEKVAQLLDVEREKTPGATAFADPNLAALAEEFAEIRISNLESQMQQYHDLKAELKRRTMIYQYEEKVSVAKAIGVEPEVLFEMPYETWSAVRKLRSEQKESAAKDVVDDYLKRTNATCG